MWPRSGCRWGRWVGRHMEMGLRWSATSIARRACSCSSRVFPPALPRTQLLSILTSLEHPPVRQEELEDLFGAIDRAKGQATGFIDKVCWGVGVGGVGWVHRKWGGLKGAAV